MVLQSKDILIIMIGYDDFTGTIREAYENKEHHGKPDQGPSLPSILESAADLQKSRAKKLNPKRFVDTGLYRLVRCPNYLGEMLFWTGVILSGIGSVQGWQWLMCLIGYISIIFVMFSGARRLEIRQNKNYGSDPEYQKYVKSVPILVPFIPLYSVEKYKWLVA